MERIRTKPNGTRLKRRASRLLTDARELGRDGLAEGKEVVHRFQRPAMIGLGVFLLGFCAGFIFRSR